MSRVLLVSSILAMLPIAAAASSITTVPAISGDAPSVIRLGTPGPAPVKKPVRDVNKGVTPMVMRGGITGGPSPVRAAAPAVAMEPEIAEETFSEEQTEQN